MASSNKLMNQVKRGAVITGMAGVGFATIATLAKRGVPPFAQIRGFINNGL